MMPRNMHSSTSDTPAYSAERGSNMAKQVMIMAVIDDDWDEQEFFHECNDALVKHDVVMYVEDTIVTVHDYKIPVEED